MVSSCAWPGTVPVREDYSLARVERDRFAARLCPRPLLYQQQFSAFEVATALAEHARELERKRDVAVQILMQAVVAALFVTKDQRRRSGLSVSGAELPGIPRAKPDTNRARASARPIDSPWPPARDTSRRATPRPAAASVARNTCTHQRRSDAVPSRRGCESARALHIAQSAPRIREHAAPSPSWRSLAHRDRARCAPSPAPRCAVR